MRRRPGEKKSVYLLLKLNFKLFVDVVVVVVIVGAKTATVSGKKQEEEKKRNIL